MLCFSSPCWAAPRPALTRLSPSAKATTFNVIRNDGVMICLLGFGEVPHPDHLSAALPHIDRRSVFTRRRDSQGTSSGACWQVTDKLATVVRVKTTQGERHRRPGVQANEATGDWV